MPQGAHGSGQRAEIQKGHIKKMGRQFNVLECLKAQIPGL